MCTRLDDSYLVGRNHVGRVRGPEVVRKGLSGLGPPLVSVRKKERNLLRFEPDRPTEYGY